MQSALNSLQFRIYLWTDVIGVKCGHWRGHCRRVGLWAVDLGCHSHARRSRKIHRMALALGCKHPSTLYGLSGFGDLMLTSMCELSRNRTYVYYIGKEWLSVEDAQRKVGETVEGVTTAIVTQKQMKKYGLRCDQWWMTHTQMRCDQWWYMCLWFCNVI